MSDNITSNEQCSHSASYMRDGKVRCALCDLETANRELWVLAECIFQNVSSDDAKHWARGIRCSLNGPASAPPTFTVETSCVGCAQGWHRQQGYPDTRIDVHCPPDFIPCTAVKTSVPHG